MNIEKLAWPETRCISILEGWGKKEQLAKETEKELQSKVKRKS